MPVWPGCHSVQGELPPTLARQSWPKVRVSAGVGQTKGKKEGEGPWGRSLVLILGTMVALSWPQQGNSQGLSCLRQLARRVVCVS